MRPPDRLFWFAAVFVPASKHGALAFEARFSWSGIIACGKVSPAFTIHDAPKGTESLHFSMTDKDAPNFQHGGGSVHYDGGGYVPEGAINYIGPCPPAATIHRYVWTIEAWDKSGKRVGRTTAEGSFQAP
jgi:phosphatidylethanolamine-binding protein (PEBP) family uncharacterized protein